MAARRDLTQDEHQRPWLVGGNVNHALADGSKRSAEWEQQIKRFTKIGVPLEELKEYKRTISSGNIKVNKWNDEIVTHLNDIALCRCQWIVIMIDSGSVADGKKLKTRIAAVKKEIAEIQKWIKRAGGRHEQVPVLFQSDPTLD